jgi:ATP-dependent Clp protease ATP-binding subunit ClpC
MTINLGGRNSVSIGFGDAATPDYASEVRKAFRPEFYNRLDHIVPFGSLSADVVRKITLKELAEIDKREGIVRQGLRLQYSESLIDHLASAGFHPTLGARPLQRTIETDLIAPLARWLLTHPQLQHAQLELDWTSASGLAVRTI